MQPGAKQFAISSTRYGLGVAEQPPSEHPDLRPKPHLARLFVAIAAIMDLN